QLVVDHLAYERVRELELARSPHCRGEEPRAQDLVERILGLGRRQIGRAREQLGGAAAAGDRGDGEQLVGGVAQPRESCADRLPDALRQCRLTVLEAPQNLLDEERVSAGALVNLVGHGPARFWTEPTLDELGAVGLLEA